MTERLLLAIEVIYNNGVLKAREAQTLANCNDAQKFRARNRYSEVRDMTAECVCTAWRLKTIFMKRNEDRSSMPLVTKVVGTV